VKTAISSHTDPTRQLTIFSPTGVLNFNEIMSAITSFYEGSPTKNVLWDLNEVSKINITSQEIEKIAASRPQYNKKRPEGKTAIVTRNDYYFGLSRMFETYSQLKNIPFQVMVFHTIKEAYQWVDEEESF
jgi:hypothetical protein